MWSGARDLRRGTVSVLPSDRHRDRRKVMLLAERNVRRLRRCAVRPEIVRADAAKNRVPDDITVVVLYNPFGSEVLKPALTRVLESFDRAPRRMQFACANPREHELIASMLFPHRDGAMLQAHQGFDNAPPHFRMIR